MAGPTQAPKAGGDKKPDQSFAAQPVAVKLGLLVLPLGIIGLIYFFALHMPLTDEIASVEGQHAQLLQDLEAARQRQQEYIALREQLEGRAAIDRQNKRILPERAEIPAFLQDLNNKAELSGLRIELVEPRPEEPDQFYVRIPVNLNLSGRYHQLARFFYTVSRLDRAISMENIELREPEVVAESDEVRLHVAVLATTYRQPTAADPNAPAAAGAPGAAPATPGATP